MRQPTQVRSSTGPQCPFIKKEATQYAATNHTIQHKRSNTADATSTGPFQAAANNKQGRISCLSSLKTVYYDSYKLSIDFDKKETQNFGWALGPTVTALIPHPPKPSTMKKNQVKAGDLFKMPVAEDQYLFGRVLLNIYTQVLKKKLVDGDSNFYNFPQSLLIEVFNRPPQVAFEYSRDVLIAGILTGFDCFEEGEWTVIGQEPVDPAHIEFPENVLYFDRQAYFLRGEIKLPLSFDFQKVDELNVSPIKVSPYNVHEIALYYLDLKHLIPADVVEHRSLKMYDLRYSDARSEVYDDLREAEHLSYSEICDYYSIEKVHRFFE